MMRSDRLFFPLRSIHSVNCNPIGGGGVVLPVSGDGGALIHSRPASYVDNGLLRPT